MRKIKKKNKKKKKKKKSKKKKKKQTNKNEKNKKKIAPILNNIKKNTLTLYDNIEKLNIILGEVL